MIKLETIEVSGFEGAIKGMRNPYKNREKSDSGWEFKNQDTKDLGCIYVIGPKDLDLAQRLLSSGKDDDAKFMRMIHVQVDISAPLYWWKEFDTYKVATVANSESTMHTIHKREFTLDDFAHDQIGASDDFFTDVDETQGEELEWSPCGVLSDVINKLNALRMFYIMAQEKDYKEDAKQYWYQMIQLLPSSYMQLRTVDLNYQTLRRIFFARRYHKLNEWHEFCDWVKMLPYAEELITYDHKTVKMTQTELERDRWAKKLSELQTRLLIHGMTAELSKVASFAIYILQSNHADPAIIRKEAENMGIDQLMEEYGIAHD